MKVLIVDDEQPARDRLRRLVEEAEAIEVAGEAANGHEAIDGVATLKPDVVLLDIRMPGMQGIEVAHHLNRLESPPAIIFTTAFDEYAVEAFDAQAIGYLLKPVRREKLLRALGHAARLSREQLAAIASDSRVSQPRRHLCARQQDALTLIPIEDVNYFVADQKYVRVGHAKGENLVDDSLKALEDEFSDRFVRIHRNALVAVERVAAIEKNADGHAEVRLRDNAANNKSRLQISRRHLAQVKQRLIGG